METVFPKDQSIINSEIELVPPKLFITTGSKFTIFSGNTCALELVKKITKKKRAKAI